MKTFSMLIDSVGQKFSQGAAAAAYLHCTVSGAAAGQPGSWELKLFEVCALVFLAVVADCRLKLVWGYCPENLHVTSSCGLDFLVTC